MNKLKRFFFSGVGVVLASILGFALCLEPAEAANGTNADSQCSKLSGASFGLCTAFCDAMKCASDKPSAHKKACDKVENQFRQVTGTVPPCKVAGPPPGPNLQRCFCQDGTQIELCAQVDCSSGPAQDEICGPVCASHGGESATGCLENHSSCAVQ
jgi:hypothetical protein